MKKNIIVITSAIVGVVLLTWLCVRFIDNDVYPKYTKDEDKNAEVAKIKGTKTEKIELNGKEVNVQINVVSKQTKQKNSKTGAEFFKESILYKIYLDDFEVKNINLEDYIEIKDNIEIEGSIKKTIGIDEKDYLIVKIISNGVTKKPLETNLLINDSGELIFRFSHEIANTDFEIEGTESNEYIIGSSRCEEFNYFITDESMCNKLDNMYTLYRTKDNNVYFLECIDPDNFDGMLIEKQLIIDNNKATIKNNINKYEIKGVKTNEMEFLCPTYKNLSK